MYLKAINLRGFKSFGSKNSLAFEKGLCLIVGPNGSGKSNIVDAISWVLGEQSPKSLRGSTMKDIIFKSKNEELAIAEVSLSFDNSDRTLPVEFTDVRITRRAYLRGGSEYFINSSPARLSDIQDLISHSGIGKGLYTIINQGQINNVIMYKDLERKQIIEEIIGISRHKIRRDKSKTRLTAVSEDVARINDLIAEIKRTMDPLEAESQKSKELNKIISELKELELSLFLTNINGLNHQWDSESKKTTENMKETEEIQQKLNELNDSRIIFEEEHNRQKQILSEYENKINNFNYYKNKLESIKLLAKNQQTSVVTVMNMIDFSMNNIIGKEENEPENAIYKQDTEIRLMLKKLITEIDKYTTVFSNIYSRLDILINPDYRKYVKEQFDRLERILDKIKKEILKELEPAKAKEKKITKEKSEKLKSSIIANTFTLVGKIKKEINEIINNTKILSEILKSLSAESQRIDGLLNAEFEARRKEYSKKAAIFNGFDEKINMLKSRKNFLENDSYRADLRKEQIKEKVKDLTIKIFDDYNLSLDFILKNYKEAENVEVAENRFRRLKNRLGDYKNVNPNAHLEYERIKERFDFLNSQKSDLEESKKELEVVIKDLDEEIKNIFNVKFQEINDNFKFYFKILFPIGNSELIIRDSNNNDEEEFGIDIRADIGNSKSVSLQLLSGGEKALISIAFLFAIFAANSSPFYIFDEIDSALDDANLDRFLTLVKKFSENRQIIIVSHQKKTMEIADIIYGFSMQSNGITKVISEKLKALNV